MPQRFLPGGASLGHWQGRSYRKPWEGKPDSSVSIVSDTAFAWQRREACVHLSRNEGFDVHLDRLGVADLGTHHRELLFQPLELSCGAILKNRIGKSAISDSLGDGCGNPTDAQIRLYERWDEGGVAVSIVSEVQGNPNFAEKPGNLVLGPGADLDRFALLAQRGTVDDASL